MLNLDEALKKYGLSMPDPPKAGGIYIPVKEFGKNLCYLSGCIPSFNGDIRFTGKLGREINIDQGQKAARICVLNLLANLIAKYGSLNIVKRIVKMTVFVAGTDTFYDHPKVANGASQLLVDIFGEETGCSSRSAVGVIALPMNVPVEVEILVELNQEGS